MIAEEAGFEEERGQHFVAISGPSTGPVLSEKADQLVPNW